MSKKPKLDFKKLAENNAVFASAWRTFFGSISLFKSNSSEDLKLKKQLNHLKEKREMLGEPETVLKEFKDYYNDQKDELKIPKKFKEFVKNNIEELQRTYTAAIDILENSDLRKIFTSNFLQHLELANDWLKKPDKRADKYTGPAELIWVNNVAEKKNRDETSELLFPIDAIHQVFMSRIYIMQPKLENQLVYQELIPHDLDAQKYSLMLAHVNAKYDIGLSSEHIQYSGVFLSNLAKNPRSLGNKSLYEFGNLFHNASNHSVGVVAMTMKLANESLNELTADVSKENKEHLTKVNAAYKKRMANVLLFHDGGEEFYRETLVQGEVTKLPKKEQQELLDIRDKFEAWSFFKKTLPKIAAIAEKAFGLSARAIEESEIQAIDACAAHNHYEEKQKEVLEKLHTSSDLIRLRQPGYVETGKEMMLKFSYTAKHLYGTSMSLPEDFDETKPMAEKIKAIEEVLLNAKPDYKKSLVGQIKISGGQNELETIALRKIYVVQTEKIEEEHNYYLRKAAKEFGISTKVIDKFLENMNEVNIEHLKSNRTRTPTDT